MTGCTSPAGGGPVEKQTNLAINGGAKEAGFVGWRAGGVDVGRSRRTFNAPMCCLTGTATGNTGRASGHSIAWPFREPEAERPTPSKRWADGAV